MPPHSAPNAPPAAGYGRLFVSLPTLDSVTQILVPRELCCFVSTDYPPYRSGFRFQPTMGGFCGSRRIISLLIRLDPLLASYPSITRNLTLANRPSSQNRKLCPNRLGRQRADRRTHPQKNTKQETEAGPPLDGQLSRSPVRAETEREGPGKGQRGRGVKTGDRPDSFTQGKRHREGTLWWVRVR